MKRHWKCCGHSAFSGWILWQLSYLNFAAGSVSELSGTFKYANSSVFIQKKRNNTETNTECRHRLHKNKPQRNGIDSIIFWLICLPQSRHFQVETTSDLGSRNKLKHKSQRKIIKIFLFAMNRFVIVSYKVMREPLKFEIISRFIEWQ